MEYKSVSSKLSRQEITLLKAFCEKKGTTPAALIRDLILQELDVPIPHTVAGRNRITYDKKRDAFSWLIELDSGEKSEVLRNVSPAFLEELGDIISSALHDRSAFISKKKKDSVPDPCNLLRERLR